jgi:ribosomal protein S18 acetylase RimI-like enzyme
VHAAIEANLFAYPLFHAWSRAVCHDGPDLLWTLSDIPQPLFNSVLRARLTEDDADPAIEAVIARCRARRVPVLWWTGPSTTPADLPERLLAHGFVHAGDNPGMARSLPAAVNGEGDRRGVTVRRVRDLDDLRVWNAVPGGIEARFDFYAETMNAMRHFIAFVHGTPAGTATLFPGAGAAGIYNVFTQPELRRRGIGEALTAAALDDARELGLDLAVLQASALSASLYRRMGFVESCTIGHYVYFT